MAYAAKHDRRRRERVAVDFTSEASEAGAALDGALSGRRRTAATRQVLLYRSSVLEIATGPEPEVNLLDLVVFAELAGERLKDHWIPEVFGERNHPPLLRAFERLLASSWAIAGEVLTDAQADQLRWLIADFRARTEERIRPRLAFADLASHVARLFDELEVASALIACRGHELP